MIFDWLFQKYSKTSGYSRGKENVAYQGRLTLNEATVLFFRYGVHRATTHQTKQHEQADGHHGRLEAGLEKLGCFSGRKRREEDFIIPFSHQCRKSMNFGGNGTDQVKTREGEWILSMCTYLCLCLCIYPSDVQIYRKMSFCLSA